MVVLADELLEQFFESSFPASFHICDGLGSAVPTMPSSSSSLTTFSSLGIGAGRAAAAALGVPGASASATSQAGQATRGGLRGVLDNIVTDGMRVAAEVRRRMEDAQRELEKNAVPGQQRGDEEEEDDDDQDDVPGFERGGAGGAAAGTASGRGPGEGVPGSQAYGGDAEMRSVLSSDRDLLEGADAEAGTSSRESSDGNGNVSASRDASGGAGNAAAKVVGVEFEG
jgi:hypothetical protein